MDFRIYQGGAVPGKELRIVDIVGFDVEACGGTHLDITGDVGQIRILKSSKLQDGIVRIEFTAGLAAEKTIQEKETSLEDIAKILIVQQNKFLVELKNYLLNGKKLLKRTAQKNSN